MERYILGRQCNLYLLKITKPQNPIQIHICKQGIVDFSFQITKENIPAKNLYEGVIICKINVSISKKTLQKHG